MGLDDQYEEFSKLDQDVCLRLLTKPETVVGRDLDHISTLVRRGKNKKWYMLVYHSQGSRTAVVSEIDANLPTPALVEDATDLERWGCCRNCDKTIRNFPTVRAAISHFETCQGESTEESAAFYA